jgi:hypothetical protein
MDFMPIHCVAAKPMKNLNHNVRSRQRIVAVKLTLYGTPKSISKLERVISGRPTSKGTPTGIDFTAAKIVEIINIALQLICEYPIDRNVR